MMGNGENVIIYFCGIGTWRADTVIFCTTWKSSAVADDL